MDKLDRSLSITDCHCRVDPVVARCDLESVRTGSREVETLPKVFVVSDDRDCRESLISLLSAFHFAAVAFESPDEFLEKYQTHWPGCLLVELADRGEGAIGLLEELRELSLRIPVVVIAHGVEIPNVVRVMQLGALYLTETPYDSAALRDWIRQGLSIDARQRREQEFQDAVRMQLGSLTGDERRVLSGILAGWHNKIIAGRLDIGVRTVQARRASIMRKLDCQSVAELVSKVVTARLDDAGEYQGNEMGEGFGQDPKPLSTGMQQLGECDKSKVS